MNSTEHRITIGSSGRMGEIPADSVHLIVTSPPYPMIGLWDEPFSAACTDIGEYLAAEAGMEAFESMHSVLDAVWKECFRVLAPGGILCVNVGDAVRKLGGHFRLYSNHARILSALTALGFSALPGILWRKSTNAPNKFMGSGMLPGGAYLTLEHEHILVLRKGGCRAFETAEQKANRRRSAYFWEERNVWFSDVWEIRGTRQSWGAVENALDGLIARSRSAAFPFEIPYRLAAMFSVYGDTVLDPFWGTGTTSLAAAALGRNSLGWEIEPSIACAGKNLLRASLESLRGLPGARLESHRGFIGTRLGSGKVFKHVNRWSGLPVITGQETDIVFYTPNEFRLESEDAVSFAFRVSYRETDPDETCADKAPQRRIRGNVPFATGRTGR